MIAILLALLLGVPADMPVEPVVPSYPVNLCDTIRVGMPGLNGATPERFEQIGTSAGGLPIWAEFWGNEKSSTVYVIVSNIHGNECAPTLLVDEVRKADLDSVGIWLIPDLNPDGSTNNNRRNGNGADLNHDGAGKQPESQALFDFVARVKPIAVIHIHSPNRFIAIHGPDSSAAWAVAGRMVENLQANNLPFGLMSPGTKHDFLWNGMDTPSILVELDRVSSSETPKANPKYDPVPVDRVRQEARLIIAALLVHKFGSLGGKS